MSFTVSDTSTTASPLSTPSLKSSKKSSFMIPSRGLVWRQDYNSVRVDGPEVLACPSPALGLIPVPGNAVYALVAGEAKWNANDLHHVRAADRARAVRCDGRASRGRPSHRQPPKTERSRGSPGRRRRGRGRDLRAPRAAHRVHLLGSGGTLRRSPALDRRGSQRDRD